MNFHQHVGKNIPFYLNLQQFMDPLANKSWVSIACYFSCLQTLINIFDEIPLSAENNPVQRISLLGSIGKRIIWWNISSIDRGHEELPCLLGHFLFSCPDPSGREDHLPSSEPAFFLSCRTTKNSVLSAKMLPTEAHTFQLTRCSVKTCTEAWVQKTCAVCSA